MVENSASDYPRYEAQWGVVRHSVLPLLHVTMRGVFRTPDMDSFEAEYCKWTDSFVGTSHVVLADMRGLRTLPPRLAMQMGRLIEYGRKHGVALCAHLSEETVSRLQLARISRQGSPDDDVTVNVSSMEEAEAVCLEAVTKLRERPEVTQLRELLGIDVVHS